MKRKFGFAAILLIVLSFLLSFAVSAEAEIPEERQLPLLVDDADLLSDFEESLLLNKLTSLSEKLRCEIAVVTVDSLGGKSAQDFADDFYDYNGYGYGSDDDGVLFLISMGEREWAISTYGIGHYALTDSALDAIENNVISYLSRGDYYEAFSQFADACDSYVRYYYSSDNVDEDDPWIREITPQPTSPGTHAIAAFLIAFVISLIVVSVMKSKLKSVRFQSGAGMYVVPNSMILSNSNDIFLYSNVVKTRRESSSSSSSGGGSHTSSSGRSHGGRSGHF